MRWRMTLWLIVVLAAAASAALSAAVGDDSDIGNNHNGQEPKNPQNDKNAVGSNGDGTSTTTTDSSTTVDTSRDSSTTEDTSTDSSTTEDTSTDSSTTEDTSTDSSTTENASTDTSTTDGTSPEDQKPSTDQPGAGNDDTNASPTISPTTDGLDQDPDDDRIVNTYSGPIQGFPWQGNNNITGFFDIPYGNFSKPLQVATPAANWTTTHDVQEHAKRCPQLKDNRYIEGPDCLTLSIFKPVDAENASILFHIHDEHTSTGSGDPSIYGPDYLVPNGIILVLPNYRLGPLGFLCVQNTTLGNLGLKDLSLALKWIHRNIKHFGGNPNNIAVSGEGKSGALAGFLALSPLSKRYVKKVITESGSFLSYLSLDRNPNATAAGLLKKIKETRKDEPEHDITFDTLDAEDILLASKGIEFRPCLEPKGSHAFMVESPFEILSPAEDEKTEKEKIEISFLIGSAMFAGTHEALAQTEASIKAFNENPTLLLPNDLIFNSSKLERNAGNAVKAQYFGSEPISSTNVRNISLYFTDMAYLGPGIRSARLLVAAGATVYFYEFAYTGTLNRELVYLNRPVMGAVRGDTAGYLFTLDNDLPNELPARDSEMVGTLTQMWTDFLKTGSPSTDTVKWDKLAAEKQEDEEWLMINDRLEMKKGLYPDRLSLWTVIYKYHFVDNRSHKLSPSVYVAGFQFAFWMAFCRGVNKII